MVLSIVLTAIITAALCAVAWWMGQKLHVSVKTSKEEPKPVVVPNAENNEDIGHDSMALFLETLEKLGCAYEIDEKDNIEFRWQGGNFVGVVSNAPFVTVWYFGWDNYALSDIDSIARARKVINQTNFYYEMNVLYTIDEEDGIFYLTTKKHFLFIRQIPDIEGYLAATLNSFFVVRREVEREMDKLKNQEEKVYKS